MTLAENAPGGRGLRDLLDANPMVGDPKPTERRFWTGREEMILRNHYPSAGLIGCLDKLPGRSATSIYQHARILGLVSPAETKRGGLPKQRWASSDAIDSIIGQVYPRAIKRNDIAKLAQTVGRPSWWVTRRATALGLVQPRFREPPWTAAEEAYVAEYAHHQPAVLQRALKRMGYRRTAAAIVVKIKRLGVSTEDPDHFTARGLAQAMGVNDKIVGRWIVNGWLKAQRRGTDRTDAQGGDQWWIHRKDVRRFIIESVAVVDIRKVDKVWFVELLTGRD